MKIAERGFYYSQHRFTSSVKRNSFITFLALVNFKWKFNEDGSVFFQRIFPISLIKSAFCANFLFDNHVFIIDLTVTGVDMLFVLFKSWQVWGFWIIDEDYFRLKVVQSFASSEIFTRLIFNMQWVSITSIGKLECILGLLKKIPLC